LLDNLLCPFPVSEDDELRHAALFTVHIEMEEKEVTTIDIFKKH